MADFSLKMLSINGVFYEGPCHCLIFPAPDGEKAIMAHHEEVMVAMKEGVARLQKEEHGDWTSVVVGTGYVQTAHNRVVLLADTIEKPEEIDGKRAQAALERANERLRQKQSRKEYFITRAAMSRALVRLKETEKFTDR